MILTGYNSGNLDLTMDFNVKILKINSKITDMTQLEKHM